MTGSGASIRAALPGSGDEDDPPPIVATRKPSNERTSARYRIVISDRWGVYTLREYDALADALHWLYTVRRIVAELGQRNGLQRHPWFPYTVAVA